MFGDNSEGQLGIGSSDGKLYQDRPHFVEAIQEEVTMISCGYRHTLFLTENGKVYGAGTNRRSELGMGSATQSKFMTPIRIQALEMYMITKVVAGSFSSALTSQNEILLWGSGDFGTFISP